MSDENPKPSEREVSTPPCILSPSLNGGKFQSPLSRYIQLFCSQCPRYPEDCNMSETGLARMKMCIFCALLFGYEETTGQLSR